MHVHDLTRARAGPREELVETAELALAAHERRLLDDAERLDVRRAHHPVRAHRLCLALERERRDRLIRESAPRQRARALADEHLACGGHALDPLCGVHGVTGHRVRGDLTLERAGDDLAGVEADAHREPDAVLSLEAVIALSD